MKLRRRAFLHLAAGAVALPAVSRFAWAQTYPTRPVRLIVGFTPGGRTGFAAGRVAQCFAERLGHPFGMDDRRVAGSNLATERRVNSPTDAYPLLRLSTWAGNPRPLR